MLHEAIRRTKRLYFWRKTYYIDGKTQMRVAWAQFIGTPVYTLPSLGPLYEEDRQFSGSGISLISGSGFGILKQKRGEIRYWKFEWEVGWQKQPSRLRNWTKFWVGLSDWRTLLELPYGSICNNYFWDYMKNLVKVSVWLL